MFLHFFTFLVKFTLCNSGKARRLKLFYKQEVVDDVGRCLSPGKPIGLCLVSIIFNLIACLLLLFLCVKSLVFGVSDIDGE